MFVNYFSYFISYLPHHCLYSHPESHGQSPSSSCLSYILIISFLKSEVIPFFNPIYCLKIYKIPDVMNVNSISTHYFTIKSIIKSPSQIILKDIMIINQNVFCINLKLTNLKYN